VNNHGKEKQAEQTFGLWDNGFFVPGTQATPQSVKKSEPFRTFVNGPMRRSGRIIVEKRTARCHKKQGVGLKKVPEKVQRKRDVVDNPYIET